MVDEEKVMIAQGYFLLYKGVDMVKFIFSASAKGSREDWLKVMRSYLLWKVKMLSK